jgi:Matrixin
MVWRDVACKFAVFLVTGISSISFAYPTPVDFDGLVLRWEDPDTIYLETKFDSGIDEEFVNEIVWQAVDKWNSIPSARMHIAPPPENLSAKITIHFSNSEGADSTAGYAVFDASDGRFPSHCSIEIYTSEDLSVDLAKTILHEIGHCLGLGHSLVPEAIMSYRLEKNSFALDLDDIAAVSRLYPADKKDPQLPHGCAIASSPASGTRANSVIFVLWILPLLFLGRKPWSVKHSRAEGSGIGTSLL